MNAAEIKRQERREILQREAELDRYREREEQEASIIIPGRLIRNIQPYIICLKCLTAKK